MGRRPQSGGFRAVTVHFSSMKPEIRSPRVLTETAPDGRAHGADRAPGRRAMRASLLAVLALATAGFAAFGEERSLKPSYDFIVEANGTADKAWKLYTPKQKTKILLIAPKGDEYFVSVPDKSVRPVDRSLTKTNSDGTLDILA